MSDDSVAGAHQDACVPSRFERAMDLSRRVVPIDLLGGRRWPAPWCGTQYRPVLIRTRDGRWFCGRDTLDGYETPPEYPYGVRYLELTLEQALLWCTQQGATPPPDLIQAYEASKAQPDVRPQAATPDEASSARSGASENDRSDARPQAEASPIPVPETAPVSPERRSEPSVAITGTYPSVGATSDPGPWSAVETPTSETDAIQPEAGAPSPPDAP